MDQPALRYFWRNLEDRPPDVYQMLVNIFGARWSASIANYALKMTARDAKDVPQAVRDAVLRDFYMDDFLKSVKTVLEAIEMLLQVSSTVAVGGFRLTNQLPKERALGVLWDAENDVIGIRLDWDADLPEEDVRDWKLWLDALRSLPDVHKVRCYKPSEDEPSRRELHLFCDASTKVAYFRLVMPDGDLHCSFVMSKTRVAPLKMMSIVRLELQAAVLAVRLAEAIKKEVTCRIDETVYWSDSKVVLGYIMNESRRFHVFVAVRISEIHDSTTPNQWRHVPGCENPADDCSRGVSAAKLSPDCRWLTGPSFLWNSVESWPEDIPLKSSSAPMTPK
ncbi:uncharacterized protein LOC141906748 [Tubulanus polymorphus]|uniref:uncharacterized protein LOC141906748 n=1 Tax=Tubulanus polymorphus TaxID=672921 RepID=UPI003DA4191E